MFSSIFPRGVLYEIIFVWEENNYVYEDIYIDIGTDPK